MLPAHPRLLRLAILPAALCAALYAHAQQTPQVEVQGSTANYNARRDDTAMRIVVGHDEIVRYGDTNLLDVLKRIPGVIVNGAAGRGGEIRMQGLGSGYTQVLVNGERPPGGMQADTLAPDTVERIEVLRAPSAEFSNEGIAGTINIVLKKAASKPQRELKLGYGVGRDTHSPSASLHLANRRDAFTWDVAGSLVHDRFRGEVPGREEEADAAGRRTMLRTTAGHEDGRMTTLNLAPKLGWKLDGDMLELESYLNLNRFRVDVNAPTATLLGPLPAYPDKRIAMDNDNDTVRSMLHWMHALESGARLDAKLGVSAGRTDNISTRTAGGNPQVAPLTRTIASRGRDRGLRTSGKLTVPLIEAHALAVGWEGAYDRRSDARRETDYLDPAATIPGGDEHYSGHVARLAAYAQDEWQLTPQLAAYLGARWEGVRIHADGSSFGSARSQSGVFSPVLQLLYKLPGTKEDQLRLALSRTYKAPGMDSLLPHRYISVNNSPAEPDTEGNPKLKPELALGLDAAWEHHWAEGAMLSLSASTRRIDDYARSLVLFDGRRWISLPSNVGKARTHSLQLETGFPLPALIDGAPPLELRANVARNWSSVDGVPGPDNRLDEQVPLSANAGVDYQGERMTAGANFGFRSGGRVAVAANQAVWLHARRELELYAAWRLDQTSQLRISAANLLGMDMVNERSYLDTASGALLRSRVVNVGHPSLKLTLESRF
ncbi:TonB-dependent receptor plug domain-containing protein [Massilia aerilata]|uniref:TonB-dependent receptor plug domain-containing protein n=1 Tax=Massilia aerilata TaxID=453817 RepID=A0ABW0RY75_9BURK